MRHQTHSSWPAQAVHWYLEWALPGLGMFSEAYIIFSAGQIRFLQEALYPSCFNSDAAKITDCNPDMIGHLADYIQICGIIAGMLLWGFLGDITGRKWGSTSVAAIMLTGCILLTFSALAPSPNGYLVYFLVAQTWYGFGVGGEYPMASSSAAERASVKPELRAYRGRQVVLVFSNQGLGSLINVLVLTACAAMFGATGDKDTITHDQARKVLCVMYGVGTAACAFMVFYRFVFLRESEMFSEIQHIEGALEQEDSHFANAKLRRYLTTLQYFWARGWVASTAWIANDFAFYGNKLQQGLFLNILFPGATPYKQLQWSVLNSFIALTGYYTAAWLIDKPWYGRRFMQSFGFFMMFVFYIIIYAEWENMAVVGVATVNGARAMQAMYYLSSYFNQFGPNATTWLVAGEIFPTDIRATMHGIAAAMGKVGAIIASVWISYIADKRKIFLISAIWGIAGAIVTWIWLPDTTGMELEEYDRMQRCILEGRFQDYHGEGVNPKYLSVWEKYVLGWHKQYDPSQDRQDFETEMKRLSRMPEAMTEMGRMHSVHPEELRSLSQNAY